MSSYCSKVGQQVLQKKLSQIRLIQERRNLTTVRILITKMKMTTRKRLRTVTQHKMWTVLDIQLEGCIP